VSEFVLGWSVFTMKIISYNVRGLRGFEKRNKVNKLVFDKKTICFMFTRD